MGDIASSPGFSKSAHWHAIAVGTCYCKIWGSHSARPENTVKNKQKPADELETVVQTFSSMKWVVSKSLECQKFSRINKLYETGSLVVNRNNGTYRMSAPLATDLDFSIQWAGTRKWINQVYFNICGQELNFVDSVGGRSGVGTGHRPIHLSGTSSSVLSDYMIVYLIWIRLIKLWLHKSSQIRHRGNLITDLEAIDKPQINPR